MNATLGEHSGCVHGDGGADVVAQSSGLHAVG